MVLPLNILGDPGRDPGAVSQGKVSLRSKRFCGVREQRITARKMEPPLSFFLALAPFSAQTKHQKSRSLVFLCFQTPRKRLLRRLRETQNGGEKSAGDKARSPWGRSLSVPFPNSPMNADWDGTILCIILPNWRAASPRSVSCFLIPNLRKG